MGWNGGKGQYCSCGAPVSVSVDNIRKTCIECHQEGCLICLTHVFERGKLVEGQFKHLNNCETEGLGETFFDEIIDQNFGPYLNDTKASELIIALRGKYPQYFAGKHGNGRPHIDLRRGLFSTIDAQFVNGSGSMGPCHEVRYEGSSPSSVASRLVEYAKSKLDK